MIKILNITLLVKICVLVLFAMLLFYISDILYLIISIVSLGLYILFYASKNYRIGPGIMFFLITCFLRYIVYPVLLYNTFEPSISNSVDILLAFHLYLYELIFLIVFLEIIRLTSLCNYNAYYGLGVNVNLIAIMSVSLIVLFVSAILNPHTISRFRLFYNLLNDNTTGLINTNNNIIGAIFFWFKYLAQSVCIVYFAKRLYLTNKFRYVFLLILSIILPAMFILDTSRHYLLMTLMAGCFTVVKIFPKCKSKVMYVSIFFLFSIILITSILKFSRNYDLNFDETSIIYTNLLNSYFSGIPNVMNGIYITKIWGDSVSVDIFLNDMLSNIMLLSNYFKGINTNYLFNQGFYSHLPYDVFDQIQPCVTQGLFYGGVYLSPVFSLVALFCILLLDKIYFMSDNLLFAYISAYCASMLGMCVHGSFSHYLTCIANTYLPVCFIVYLLCKIYKIKKI